MVLPTPINADGAQAQFENGVLTLTLPKAEEAKPKQIRLAAATAGGCAKGLAKPSSLADLKVGRHRTVRPIREGGDGHSAPS